jgi:flagellar biosynthesis/type III secretory pathway M-ring protein FliF/YscJ
MEPEIAVESEKGESFFSKIFSNKAYIYAFIGILIAFVIAFVVVAFLVASQFMKRKRKPKPKAEAKGESKTCDHNEEKKNQVIADKKRIDELLKNNENKEIAKLEKTEITAKDDASIEDSTSLDASTTDLDDE